LEAAGREKPDLILCDLEMPKKDGFEVARTLKSHPTLRTIPLVAITAFAMVGDRDKVLSVGFNGYISKPIDPQKFVFLVQGYIPSKQGAANYPLSGPASESKPLPAQGYTILVVDDLPANLYLARSILEPSGYRVVTAAGIGEALERARQESPDLILSDVCMGDGSGFDFIQKVKTDSNLQSIPVIFISSTKMNEQDRSEGLRLGAARYLFRPIDSNVLLTEIESCLSEE
jgi:CheY-like chemotaxis protein